MNYSAKILASAAEKRKGLTAFIYAWQQKQEQGMDLS